MTENEWNNCDDPQAMLDFMREKADDRLFYLFASACCRRSWPLLTNPASRRVVELAEGFADGEFTREETHSAVSDAQKVAELKRLDVTRGAAEAAAAILRGTPVYGAKKCESCISLALAIVAAGEPLLTMDDTWVDDDRYVRVEKQANASLARDIFRHPSQSAPQIDTAWLTWRDAAIPQMCQRMYDSNTFTQMDGLGRTLQNAGCTNQHILEHCGSSFPHFRGCWLVDAILGQRWRTGSST